MFCRKCGNELEDNQRFCNLCGNLVGDDINNAPANSSQNSIQQPVTNSTFQNVTYQNSANALNNTNYNAAYASSVNKKNRSYIGIIAIISLVLIIVGVIIGVLVVTLTDSSTGGGGGSSSSSKQGENSKDSEKNNTFSDGAEEDASFDSEEIEEYYARWEVNDAYKEVILQGILEDFEEDMDMEETIGVAIADGAVAGFAIDMHMEVNGDKITCGYGMYEYGYALAALELEYELAAEDGYIKYRLVNVKKEGVMENPEILQPLFALYGHIPLMALRIDDINNNRDDFVVFEKIAHSENYVVDLKDDSWFDTGVTVNQYNKFIYKLIENGDLCDTDGTLMYKLVSYKLPDSTNRKNEKDDDGVIDKSTNMLDIDGTWELSAESKNRIENELGAVEEVLSSKLEIKKNKVELEIEFNMWNDTYTYKFCGKYDNDGKFTITKFSVSSGYYIEDIAEDFDKEEYIEGFNSLGLPTIFFENATVDELNEYFEGNIKLKLNGKKIEWEKIK